MSRGRHRQKRSLLVALALLVILTLVVGGSLAAFLVDRPWARFGSLGVSAGVLLGLVPAALLFRRERRLRREVGKEAATLRTRIAKLTSQLAGANRTLGGLNGRLAAARSQAERQRVQRAEAASRIAALNATVAQQRVELADLSGYVERVREAGDVKPVRPTQEMFLRAYVVLSAFESGQLPVRPVALRALPAAPALQAAVEDDQPVETAEKTETVGSEDMVDLVAHDETLSLPIHAVRMGLPGRVVGQD